MEQSENNLPELYTALAKFAVEVNDPVKDKTVRAGKYSYEYAPLQNWIGSMRKLLSKHGLLITQTAEGGSKEIAIVTQLSHVAGGWIRGQLCMSPTDASPQGTGTMITYARRYALMSILGIAADDDTDATDHPRFHTTTDRTQTSDASFPPSDSEFSKSEVSATSREALISTIKDQRMRQKLTKEAINNWGVGEFGHAPRSDAELKVLRDALNREEIKNPLSEQE